MLVEEPDLEEAFLDLYDGGRHERAHPRTGRRPRYGPCGGRRSGGASGSRPWWPARSLSGPPSRVPRASRRRWINCPRAWCRHSVSRTSARLPGSCAATCMTSSCCSFSPPRRWLFVNGQTAVRGSQRPNGAVSRPAHFPKRPSCSVAWSRPWIALAVVTIVLAARPARQRRRVRPADRHWLLLSTVVLSGLLAAFHGSLAVAVAGIRGAPFPGSGDRSRRGLRRMHRGLAIPAQQRARAVATPFALGLGVRRKPARPRNGLWRYAALAAPSVILTAVGVFAVARRDISGRDAMRQTTISILGGPQEANSQEPRRALVLHDRPAAKSTSSN